MQELEIQLGLSAWGWLIVTLYKVGYGPTLTTYMACTLVPTLKLQLRMKHLSYHLEKKNPSFS